MKGPRLIKKITIKISEVMKEKNVDMFPSQESLNGHTTRQLCLCHRNGSNIMWSNLKEAEDL